MKDLEYGMLGGMWRLRGQERLRAMLINTAILTSLWCMACSTWTWADPFAIHDLRVNGRVITVIAAELRQNRREDLIVLSKTGMFPQEMRWVSVFWQQEGGRFPTHPDLTWQMDPEATVIDVGALGTNTDHKALIYLAGSEVRAYALKNGVPPSSTTLLSVPTFPVLPEAGDLPAWPLIHDWKGTGRAWLGIPQFGQLALYALGPQGLSGSAETLHLHQPSRILPGEVEQRLIRDYALQLMYRFPQLFVRDFNGDGRADLIAAWQDNVAVYLQGTNGRFPPQPSRTFHMTAVNEGEKNLRSTLVSPIIDDLNGNGFADLVLTKMTGRLTERRLVTTIYLNRDGSLPTQPDARIEHEGFGTTLLLKDLNGDGKRDLVFPLVKIGVRNILSNLLSNRVDVSLLAHFFRDREVYNNAADWTRTFPYQIDLSDGVMLEGAWPNIGGDFDGDGAADLLITGTEEVAIYRANPGGFFARDAATRLTVKTSPQMMVRALGNHGRADIVMWYKGDPDWSGVVKVLMNSGEGWGHR
jgi:hypothetical protein